MQALHLRGLRSAAGITALFAMALICAASARADWNPGDPYKMHYPQLPDPFGWDVNFSSPMTLADDWLCTESGPVSDIHLWFSSMNDNSFSYTNVQIAIYADVPAVGTVSNSHPGTLLWQRTIGPIQASRHLWGSGDQGWYDPYLGTVLPANHTNIWQLDINNIVNAFTQNVGTVYWLGVTVAAQGGPLGWKTSISPHFGDDACWLYPGGGNNWIPLVSPSTGESLDMAFVITPEPSSIALVALGIGGLWFGCRNRKR
jgi:hypothetical protein